MTRLLLLSSIICTVLLAGCGTTAKFVYPADFHDLEQVSSSASSPVTIAVKVFDDERDSSNTTGTWALAYIPLMPWGWCEFNRPDAAEDFLTIDRFDFNPSEDLAKAAAVSLRRSGLFKDAFFSFGGEASQADFVLTGQIKSTRYIGRHITYGLSIFGKILSWFGLPYGNSQNELILDLQLRRQGKVIWSYRFDDSDTTWQGYLYNDGGDVECFAELMQDAMNQAVKELQRTKLH